jgi:hypothetical protein
MGRRINGILIFSLALVVVAFIFSPVSTISAGDKNNGANVKAGSAIPFSDALKGLLTSKENTYFYNAETAYPQEHIDRRKTPETKRIPFAAPLAGSFYGLLINLGGNRLPGAFRKRGFERRMIAPYGALAPPQACPA